jgi:flagellar assembly factor FliW
MQIQTTRFGFLEVEPDAAHNDALAWLQSVTRPDIALAVVSPRRYVPGYQVRISRSELTSLDLDDLRHAEVLVIVSRNEYDLTLNLKAPLVINLRQRLGRQVITNADQLVQYPLQTPRNALRKSA